MDPLRGEKPGLHPKLTYVRVDRGCRNPIPGDVAETRGFPLYVPNAKEKFKRLATRDTLHGSRPNLRQREPDGRIVPTPPDVWDKGASTKRCAQRRKKNHNYSYTYLVLLLHCSVGQLITNRKKNKNIENKKLGSRYPFANKKLSLSQTSLFLSLLLVCTW